MKKHILLLLLLITSLFSSNVKVKNILLLHTYDYQYPWTKSLFDGMDTIQRESSIPIKFYTEQIDFQKIKLKEKDKWIDYFSNKYKTIHIDGIVIVFGNAIKFINEYGNTIFKDIPKVVYGDTNINKKKNTIFMSIENSFAVEKTVKEALLQNKNAKKIYILGNEGELTQKLKDLTKQYVKKYTSNDPTIIPNLTIDELEILLRELPKDSIVFYCLFFKDKDGIKLSPRKYLEKFSQFSNAPIYTYYSVLLGSGTAGGYVIDSNLLMQNMIKALIYGEKKIVGNTYSIVPMFDYDILKKYNINTNKIPNDTIVINKPINYFKIYMEDILITILTIVFFFFILTVITNKKRKQKLIQELKTKDKLLHMKDEFNSFFELSINLQIIADVNDGRIIQINKAAKSILGYQVKELVNTTFLDLVHPDDIQDTFAEMKKLSNGENVYFFENRFKHKNGDYINLAWSSTTDTKNKLLYATAQNITKVKLIEIQEKEKEKLYNQQSKLAAMGEMLGNIAHQWRQPLSTITTAATGAKIQKEMDCLSDEQLNSVFTSINNSAQYLSQTIEDFRDFFNPSNNKVSTFLISNTVEKTLSLVQAQFNAKNILIVKNIDEIEVTLIENELIQVLINILNNSRDALINIKSKERIIFINVYKKERELIIEIKDNAEGIKEDIIDRIFEPYFTTKHKSQGTGIGLYMSQDIIVNHLKGTISVKNEIYIYKGIEYKGSKFIINIPCQLNSTL
jgi:PAS domain S-box-containing protein